MTVPIDYNFLNFFYKLGGAIVPIFRKKGNRAPAIKWGAGDFFIEKDHLIREYSFDAYNYSFKLPENIAVIDVEAHKNGLEEIEKLKNELGVDVFNTYYHRTGRGGIHAFYKVSKTMQKSICKGYLKGYKGIEILYGKNVLVPVPPSTHYDTGQPYTVGNISQIQKNIKPFPSKLKDFFDKTPVNIEGRDEGIVQQDKFDDLEHCLRYLDVKKFSDYDTWVRILFSAYDFVKGDKKGLKIFTEWSTQDPKYQKDINKIKNLWDKVKHVKKEKNDPRNLITYKTIIFHALKAGCKIKINIGKLIDEIFINNFDFVSTLENDGEYVRDIVEGRDLFKNSINENIGKDKWARLTNGAIALVQGYVYDQSGIMKKDFIEMRIKDLIERNRISLFKKSWNEIEFRYNSQVKEIEELKYTKKLFFNLLKHQDDNHAKRVYPFFVRYMVSGIKANLEEFDDKHRSNSQTCLCINSEQQGIGKSTFARALTPCPEMIYYPNLKNIRDNETKLAISRASMCIIDDYQPTYQKELNNLNEILTQNTIMARPKYGRIEIPKTRRAFFALTTNYKKILNDYSGTRRWINIDLLDMQINEIIKIMPQVHGEMISLARCDFRHWFTIEEIQELEKLNRPFSGGETLDDILLKHVETDNTIDNEEMVSPIDLMKKINKSYGGGTIRDVRQIGSAIKRIFSSAESRRLRKEGSQLTFYALKIVEPFENELTESFK